MKRIFILFLPYLFILGCIKNNPDPSWISVSEWDLQVNPNSINPSGTGVLTSSITDAWVFMDGELIGVFEVPFKIPILDEGSHTLLIYPTVKNNGISATKKIYPFLEPYEINVNLVQNETVSINPVTRYFAGVKFWIEDFEDSVVEIADGPSSSVSLERTNDPSILNSSINEGYYGRVQLTSTNDNWIGSTVANSSGTLEMNLPRGKEVYLEIDYYNTNQLVTGVLAISSTGFPTDNVHVRLNAQNDGEVVWKKIYIDLREIVSASTNAQYFEFSFKALLDAGDISGEVNIDNIKEFKTPTHQSIEIKAQKRAYLKLNDIVGEIITVEDFDNTKKEKDRYDA